MAAGLVSAGGQSGQPPSSAPLTAPEKLGKRLYLIGVGSSTIPVTARLGDSSLEIPGTALPCVNCHALDGRGKPEGNVIPTDITWSSLTKPYGHDHPDGRRHPPFTDATLGRAITMGFDPAGQPLAATMPRYSMSREDLADLVAYLKRLGQESEPGVADDAITVGALLPREGPLADAGAALQATLAAYFAEVNEAGGVYHRRLELRVLEAESTGRTPGTAEKPGPDQEVFALVSPLAPGAEERLAGWAEDEAVPYLGTLSLFPEPRPTPRRYVFYLFPGLEEQARALLKFFAEQPHAEKPRLAVVYPERPDLAGVIQRVEEQSRALGWSAPQRLAYAAAFNPAEAVRTLAGGGADAVVFLGPAADLDAFLREADQARFAPSLLLFGSLVGKDILESPRSFENKLFLAYPTLPEDQTAAGLFEFRVLAQKRNVPLRHAALQLSAYCSAKVLVEALKRAGRELHREGLVTALEGFYEFPTGLTRPVTFGPNRHTGLLGAYVVRVDLEKKQFVPGGQWIGVN